MKGVRCGEPPSSISLGPTGPTLRAGRFSVPILMMTDRTVTSVSRDAGGVDLTALCGERAGHTTSSTLSTDVHNTVEIRLPLW